jgi:uncharacterized protein (TIGR02611 family)
MLKTLKQVKRLIIAVVGFTVLLIGVAMIVLPGPAIIVIPIGLGILGTEFAWARRLLNNIKNRFQKKDITGEDSANTSGSKSP